MVWRRLVNDHDDWVVGGGGKGGGICSGNFGIILLLFSFFSFFLLIFFSSNPCNLINYFQFNYLFTPTEFLYLQHTNDGARRATVMKLIACISNGTSTLLRV